MPVVPVSWVEDCIRSGSILGHQGYECVALVRIRRCAGVQVCRRTSVPVRVCLHACVHVHIYGDASTSVCVCVCVCMCV